PFLLFLSGGFSLVLSLYAQSKRPSTLIHVFSLFSIAVFIYAFGYGFEFLSRTLEDILFWSKIQYLGISFLPGLVLSFSICYTGRQGGLSPLRLVLIFTIPMITLLARLLNPYHFLFYKTVAVDLTAGMPLLNFEPGPFYLIHVCYSNIALIFSSFLLIKFFIHAAPSYRKQTMTILIASSIQWIGYVIYLSGLGPENLDINPLLFSLSVMVYAFGIFKFSLFNLVPMARETVFEGMQDAILVVDPEMRLVDYNRRCLTLLPEIHKNNIGEDIKTILAGYPKILKILTMTQATGVKIPLMENNMPLFFQVSLLPLFDRKKRKLGSIIALTDVTRQTKFMHELEKMATIDELTGIHNRRNLMIQAEIEMSRSIRNGRPMSLILIDLDNFKSINDTWGHHCGDLVLKAFARTVKHNIREIDIFGRYGGDEFIIVLPETDQPIALETANRLCRLVADLPVNFKKQIIKLTISIGVSGTRDLKNQSVETLLQYADKALYTAKKNGSNRVAYN
ncbi:MAG: hypothetical protein DRH26_06365, partial [Deltaproteobacteria bacterium]